MTDCCLCCETYETRTLIICRFGHYTCQNCQNRLIGEECIMCSPRDRTDPYEYDVDEFGDIVDNVPAPVVVPLTRRRYYTRIIREIQHITSNGLFQQFIEMEHQARSQGQEFDYATIFYLILHGQPENVIRAFRNTLFKHRKISLFNYQSLQTLLA